MMYAGFKKYSASKEIEIAQVKTWIRIGRTLAMTAFKLVIGKQGTDFSRIWLYTDKRSVALRTSVLYGIRYTYLRIK